ncbi:MAG: type I 3-dehydroquinate dehydratase [Verrucomicrobiales bacterium]
MHCNGDFEALGRSDLSELCDLVEFRLDSLSRATSGLAEIIERVPIPVIITARHPAEGGDHSLSSDERRRLLSTFLPHADVIDVELRALPEFGPILEEARKAGVSVILSHHDLDQTPAPAELRQIVQRAADAGADVAKVATRLANTADLFALTELFEQPPPIPTSAMGMGELGRVSRLLLAQCGSRLNYGYLARSNAPGQWPAARLKELIAEICVNPGA